MGRTVQACQVEPDPVPVERRPVAEQARPFGAPIPLRELPLDRAAANVGVDLARECPVCRSLKKCDCSEEDRAFVRRTRFLAGIEFLARCSRCRGPLSPIYVPRRGAPARLDLRDVDVVWACPSCQGRALAELLEGLAGRRPPVE